MINDCLKYYLPYNIILFDLNKFFNVLVGKIFSNLLDWNLLNQQISYKNKHLIFFSKIEIDKLILSIKEIYKKENIKIYIIYFDSNNKKYTEFEGWIDDFLKFKKRIISLLKKQTKFLKILNKELKFNNFVVKNNINYGIPNGEETEFLQTLR